MSELSAEERQSAVDEAASMEMRDPWHRDLVLGMLAESRDVGRWARSIAHAYSKSGSLEVTAVIVALLARADRTATLARELAEARERLARVEFLHERVPADSPFNDQGRDVCATCNDGAHASDWPCATIQALHAPADAPQGGQEREEALRAIMPDGYTAEDF